MNSGGTSAFPRGRLPAAGSALLIAGMMLTLPILASASTGYEVRGSEVTYGRKAYALIISYTEKEKISAADASSFQILDRLTYAKDANNVFYEGRVIPGADAETFELLPGKRENRSPLYARDAKRVYFEGEVLPGADPATFQIDSRRAGLSRDKDRVYVGRTPVPGADPLSFEPISADSPISRDANDFYYGSTPAGVRDLRAFELLDSSGTPGVVWGREPSAFYVGTSRTPITGTAAFADLGGGYTRDAANVFYKGEAIAGADPASFSVRIYKDDATKGDTYVVARDRRHFYTGGTPTLDVADGDTFEELGRGYARDASRVYFLSRVVEGADPATFSAEPVRGVKAPRNDAPVVRDKNAFYQAGNRISSR